MKGIYATLSLLILLILFQCASSPQKENESDYPAADTVAIAQASIEENTTETAPSETSDENEQASLDLDEFTKYPFRSDYPYIKDFLRGEGIAFNIVAEDTIQSEHRVIEFDSSRIDFLDSDERFQDELGDLICSSDIRSAKFVFNQNISIGMKQADLLSWANLTESALIKDEATSYFENKVSWGEDEGYWKVTFWFNAGLLVRIQSEINPCYYEYGD